MENNNSIEKYENFHDLVNAIQNSLDEKKDSSTPIINKLWFKSIALIFLFLSCLSILVFSILSKDPSIKLISLIGFILIVLATIASYTFCFWTVNKRDQED